MSIHRKFSIRARGASFSYAMRGLRFMMQTQHNAWLHAAATMAVCVAAAWFQITRVERCLIVLSMMTVWTAEAFNTALECLTDLASPELHPLAGKAKDVAAAAVLITAVGAATIGAVVFIPRLWTMIISFP
jgi:diacylglycerol kinase (ATP)